MKSPIPLRVRAAILQDSSQIAHMQEAMAAETEPFRLNIDIVLKGVEAVFADPTKGSYFVAEGEDGKLLGVLLTIPEWSDWRNGTVMWIHSVYTVPHARGRGVYRALYEHLKNTVQADPSLRGLRLYVEKSNHTAQKVYESLGMSSEHYHLYEWMKEF